MDLQILRHSSAHVMACAVQRLYGNTQFAIGPATQDGFYYDFDSTHTFTTADFATIEAEMAKIVAEDLPFIRQELSKAQALTLFAGQKYKIELINDLPESEVISIYKLGNFTDLCKGPHLERSGQIKPDSFKILSVAGAYWRGNEKNAMLQRLYATVFNSKTELDEYIALQAELERRDHRKLGRELDLFSFHEESGPGLAYWHPKGARIRIAIEDFWRAEHYKNGYEMLFTPHIGRSWLWETSGHLGFYKDGMYSQMDIDGDDYYIKPMNCPFHIMVYNEGKKSYRDLPCRWAELGTVYRYERSGTLQGLLRVRGFTQDDAHIICTPEQAAGEVAEVLRFSLYMLRSFKFTAIKAYLSTRPAEAIGVEEQWNFAEGVLEKVLQEAGLPYEVDAGGGAFYGPKIDLKVNDSMGREWQLTTIQFDWNETERFKMTYVDSDGKEKRPYMLHRALFGSIERFFGVLVEHFGGAFPAWLSPVQARVVPVAAAFGNYAKEIELKLRQAGLRADVDLSNERLNAKIKEANAQRIPFTLVVGGRDEQAGTVTIKVRGQEEQLKDKPLAEALGYMLGVVASKE
ncbi:MAG: threonine--tRNA ligase [Spirochaetaceae bacterium]|nr:threonine--tRNA ligase [Spirochaetaceae bacterium]